MPKQSYDIEMQTSIGKRYGTMTVEWEGEQIRPCLKNSKG